MITGIAPILPSKDSTAATGVQKSLGKDDFLTLMIAQLKAQDPTNPMDATDFSAQLAQFSSLEQMININDTLVELRDTQAALNNSSLINLIGKTINSSGDVIEFSPGQSQTLGYSLAEDASSVVVNILNSTGQTVAILTPGDQSKGINQVIWTGADGKGNTVAEGNYTFQVEATDESGNPISVKTFASGLVTEVIFEDGISYAVVNGKKIPASEISRVGAN